MFRVCVLLVGFTLLVGCKIEITAPKGGDVVSLSQSYICTSGETCLIEVNDFQFSEKFIATPGDGWVFLGWKRDNDQLCGHAASSCYLSTIGFEEHDALAAIVKSDKTYYVEPIFVRGTPIDQALATVKDEGLRACVEYEIGGDGKLQYAEQLTRLACTAIPVASIEGIQNFKGLTYIEIYELWSNEGNATNKGIDLQPLEGLRRLKTLSLGVSVWGGASNIADITPLAELTQLRSLTLVGGNITDITALAELTGLKSLTLYGPYNDLTPLTGLTNLFELKLMASGRDISDITPLAGMTKLRDLGLSLNDISDIRPLAGMTQLKYLYLSYNMVSDISPLVGLTQLESLYLNGNSDISDINPLSGLTQLQYLGLNENRIKDIGPLAGLTQLQRLELWRNEISDIASLSGLRDLKNLYLGENNIRDIRPLAGLKQLEYLDLSSNRISNLRPLSGKEKLINLWLNDNRITDISPLAGLPELRQLNVESNNISTVVDTLDTMPALQIPVISYNPITSCAEIETLRQRFHSGDYQTIYRPSSPFDCRSLPY